MSVIWHLRIQQPDPDPAWEEILPIDPFDPENQTRVILDRATDGLTATRLLTFHEKVRHDLASFQKNKICKLWTTEDISAVVHWGKIEQIVHVGQPGDERVQYQSHGPLSLMNKVPWIRNGRARVSINLTDPEDENYDEDLQNLTIREILEAYFSDVETDLQDVAAIFGLIVPETFPDVIPKDVTFNAPTGGLDIIDQLLRWTPGFIRKVQLDSHGADEHELQIFDIQALSSANIVIGGGAAGGWIQNNQVSPTVASRYGALQIIGKDELDDEVLYFDPDNPDGTGGPNELIRDWGSYYQTTWTPDLAETSEEYWKVYRCFKQPVADTKEWARMTVRATQNTDAKAWSTKTILMGLSGSSEIRSSKGIQTYNRKERQMVLSSPAYKPDPATPGDYLPREVWFRLCRTGGPISVRAPGIGEGSGGSDFAGKAYDEDGVEDVWKKYAENLVKLTFHGTATEDSTGGKIIDFFAGVKWFDLSGKTLTYGGSDYTITTHTSVHWETDGSFSVTAGDPYTIQALNTEADFIEIIEALFPGLTASPKPVTLTKHFVSSFLQLAQQPLKINIHAGDFAETGHLTGWEELGAVVMDYTLDFSSNQLTISADDESAIAVQDYADLVAQRDLVTSVEELEIYVRRNKDKEESSYSDEDITGGSLAQAEAGPHHHSLDVEDLSGPLHPTETAFKHPTNPGQEGPLSLVWEENNGVWLPYPAPHYHVVLGYGGNFSYLLGGPLRDNLTGMADASGNNPGRIDFEYYDRGTYLAWLSRPAKHIHGTTASIPDGTGGPLGAEELAAYMTYFKSASQEAPCNFVYYSPLTKFIPAQSLWDETE